jgi:predicted dienelactone hydrolase
MLTGRSTEWEVDMSGCAHPRRCLPAAALVFVAVSAACTSGAGDGGDGNAPSRREPGPPFRVTTVTENFVDSSRSGDGLTERTLDTTISYPRNADGPFPLVVFGHGFMDHPRDFTELATEWAEAGYVVAAPAFPLSNTDAPGGPNAADYVNQPGDVSFVIDEVARLSEQEGHPLDARVDTGHVGVAGHGLGVATVLGAAYNSCCRDERIDAVIAMAGVLIDLEGAYEFSETPVLLLYGDADQFIPPSTGVEIYEKARPPKFLVAITNGTHWPPYRDEVDPADEAVVSTTTDFWNRYLAGRRGALDELLADAVVEGMTTLQHETG